MCFEIVKLVGMFCSYPEPLSLFVQVLIPSKERIWSALTGQIYEMSQISDPDLNPDSYRLLVVGYENFSRVRLISSDQLLRGHRISGLSQKRNTNVPKVNALNLTKLV